MEPNPAALIATIADSVPVGIWVARAPGGEFVYANRAFAEIMGQAGRDDVAVGGYAEPYGIYTRDGRLYPEERMPFVRALAARAMVVADDISIHRGDGRRIAVRALAKPLFEGDTLAYVAITFFDVSTEAEAVRAGEEAQARLQRVIDSAPIVLWACDQNGVVTLSEGRGLGAMGFRPGELVGRSVFEMYADQPELTALTRRALAGEEVHAKSRVGPLTLETSLLPDRNEAGQLAGYLGMTLDVTEQERLQAQLVEADRLASLGTLAASVAHEVNTPLAYIMASLDHLAKEIARGETGAEALSTLVEEARLGLEQVKVIAHDLNTFSRPGEKRVPVDVRSVLDSALRMMSHELLTRARVVRQYEAVPPVLANEARLAQVFLNLLMNAAQALSEGTGSEPEIRLHVSATDGWIHVEVRDSGPGVPAAILSRIFDPFFTTKPVGQGTGLGLSICRSIVQSVGGVIEVSSPPGGGASFRVDLPQAAATEAVPSRPPREPMGKRARVLIVDDNVSLGRVLRTTLAQLYDAEVVTTGREALQRLLGAVHYDVVLCDIMMPDMTGIELFERLRVERPGREREICFMTGGAFEPRARAFLAEISNPCFEKPFDFQEIIGQVLRERASR